MSFFSRILAKLGFGDSPPESSPTPPSPAPSAPTSPPPTGTVDVVAQLERMASTHSEPLNWRTSIVDLLKLLGLDSSLVARKELANELHCPADKMQDSAQMNLWLHKTVLQKLAANGGNIPADLLH